MAQGKTPNKTVVVHLGNGQISVCDSRLHIEIPIGTNSQWIDKRRFKGNRATSAMNYISPHLDLLSTLVSLVSFIDATDIKHVRVYFWLKGG